ncbi:MAG: proton-conducting transporter membrane subunit [Reichenbachiella sp.]|uniref:proton-conducting transporter transmembrane domain-containing protein n=1 Tax=Reichenbachiella sp. TaxID=2184521 RepID=UPI003266356B
MVQSVFTSAFLLPIITLFFIGILASFKSRLSLIMRLTKIAPSIGLFSAVIGAFWVFDQGMVESSGISQYGLGLSLRFDQLSLIMYGMVSIIALVILRFSHNYLDGDAQHIKFLGRLSLTVALVQLLVLSGNVFLLWVSWVATSMALHRLLTFYPERKKAKLAAIKKFIVARIGDTAFLIAICLVYSVFHTGHLESIFVELKNLNTQDIPVQLELAAFLLVITAGLKSAQIPFHSWLLDVMEAPTPVSALLHAGLINAGPFLMIRFAYLLDVVSIAPIMLFAIGAATAFYGALVFTTQPTIKTALAYSSVAHMGFTLMVCGLGVYSASLLHLVAHSFYKAHAFLSSGSIVDQVQTKQASNFKRKGSIWRIILGFGIAISLYITIAQFWKINANTEYQVLIIGGIIFTGIISLLINAIDSSNYKFSTLIILVSTVGVLMSFFCLEQFMHSYLGNQIPELSVPTPFMMYLSGATLLLFFFTVLIQTLSPVLQKGNAFKNFGVHARNGFYAHLIIDRTIKSLLSKNYKI